MLPESKIQFDYAIHYRKQKLKFIVSLELIFETSHVLLYVINMIYFVKSHNLYLLFHLINICILCYFFSFKNLLSLELN